MATKQQLEDQLERQERNLLACRNIIRWARTQAEQIHNASSDPFIRRKVVPMLGQLDEYKNPVLHGAFYDLLDHEPPDPSIADSDDQGATEVREEDPS